MASIWLWNCPLSYTLRDRVLSVPLRSAISILTMSCGCLKWYSMQHPPSPSTRSPLHDQRELASRLLSRVFSGLQPSGLHPFPDVLSSKPVASTKTVVRSAASTRSGVAGVLLAAVGFATVQMAGMMGAEKAAAGVTLVRTAYVVTEVNGAGNDAPDANRLNVLPPMHFRVIR